MSNWTVPRFCCYLTWKFGYVSWCLFPISGAEAFNIWGLSFCNLSLWFGIKQATPSTCWKLPVNCNCLFHNPLNLAMGPAAGGYKLDGKSIVSLTDLSWSSREVSSLGAFYYCWCPKQEALACCCMGWGARCSQSCPQSQYLSIVMVAYFCWFDSPLKSICVRKQNVVDLYVAVGVVCLQLSISCLHLCNALLREPWDFFLRTTCLRHMLLCDLSAYVLP